MLVHSLKIGVFDLDQLEDDITRSSLHSLVTHISISQIRITGSSWGYL